MHTTTLGNDPGQPFREDLGNRALFLVGPIGSFQGILGERLSALVTIGILAIRLATRLLSASHAGGLGSSSSRRLASASALA